MKLQNNDDNENRRSFWTSKKDKNGKITYTIHEANLIDFLSEYKGVYNYIDDEGNPVQVKVIQSSIIGYITEHAIIQEIKNYLREDRKLEEVWAAFVASSKVTGNFLRHVAPLSAPKFNVSTKDEAFFCFRNGVVSVTKDKVSLSPYEEFPGMVWKGSINQRDYAPCDDRELENCEFSKFLFNVSGQDMGRFNFFKSVIGYLIHGYKDPSFTRAVILLDEKIDFTGRAHGGTGKGLIMKAISYLTPLLQKDGKRYNKNQNFGYDDLRDYHRVIAFDDVPKDFDFEQLFPMITGNFRQEIKYKNSKIITFELSPKALITTNYMVKGPGGNADDRRRIEVEIAPYYGAEFTPFDEFKHLLFDDWDDEQWQLFYNFMLKCCQEYLAEGVQENPKINLAVNKLMMATDPDFVTFMDDNIQLNVRYDKADLLRRFKLDSPTQHKLSARNFRMWIDSWADFHSYVALHTKSNSHYYVLFEEKLNSEPQTMLPTDNDSSPSDDDSYGYGYASESDVVSNVDLVEVRA